MSGKSRGNKEHTDIKHETMGTSHITQSNSTQKGQSREINPGVLKIGTVVPWYLSLKKIKSPGGWGVS